MSIITLNISEVNSSSKSHNEKKRHREQHSATCHQKFTSPMSTRTNWKVGIEQDFPAKGIQKKAGVAMLLSDNMDFKLEKNLNKKRTGKSLHNAKKVQSSKM